MIHVHIKIGGRTVADLRITNDRTGDEAVANYGCSLTCDNITKTWTVQGFDRRAGVVALLRRVFATMPMLPRENQ